MYRARLIAAICVMLFGVCCASAHAQEQTVFSAEDSAVKKPVPIPADVLELLKADPFASDAFTRATPAACFSASAIRLGPRVEDLIVEAQGCLRGANENMFWIFITTAHGHHLALGTPAHDLIVEKHQTNGYRDITISAAASGAITTDSLKFNGKQYTLQREKSEPAR